MDALLVEASRLAYCSKPYLSDYDAVYIKRDNDFAVLFVGKKDTILAIRGTDDLKDVLRDITAYKTSTPFGRIHKGFWKGWSKLRTLVVTEIKRNKCIDSNFYIAGHSYGGAAVSMTAGVLGDYVEATISLNGFTNLTNVLIERIFPDFDVDFTVKGTYIEIEEVDGKK